MKKILFILVVVAAAFVFQIAGFQTIANAAWGEDVLVTNYIPDYFSTNPSMDEAPNGDLYIAVEDGEHNGIRVYRSTNGGETWEWLHSFWPESGYLARPSLAYAEGSENWVIIIYEKVTSDVSRDIELFRFDPANLSSIGMATIASGIYMPYGHHLQPEIYTDTPYYYDNYYVYVTYSVYGIDYYPVYFSRSTDKGLTWSTPLEVTGGLGMNSGWQTTPDIAYGYLWGGVYITFEKMGWNGSSWTNQIWVTKSTDRGSTWNTPIQLTSSSYDSYHPRVAAANNGSVMVAYTKEYEVGHADIESHYSIDGGTNWYLSCLPWSPDHEDEVELAVSTSNGRFHAAYWHEDDEIWYSWAYATNPELGWSSPAIIVNDSSNITPFARPAVCPNPTLPVDQEACVAWTESRFVYDVIFDQVSTCGNGVIEGGEECDDGNTLNGDCCSATCALEPAGSPCPDALFCDGYETCDGSGGCQPGPPPDCSDGIGCTIDGCDENGDYCYSYSDDVYCNDGWFCNGDEICNPFIGCQPGSIPCPDDGLFCTGSEYCNEDTDGCGSTGDPCFPQICDEITDSCSGPDFDGDGVPDDLDNCVYQYNPGQEDLDGDGVGDACDNCPRIYNPIQEDTYPPQTNGCGDACECEGNFNGWEDQDVDGSDAFIFKTDFGRSRILDPCTNADPCNGDFTCDYDVDGTDAFVFKSDFGRSNILNPCPYCVTIPWCIY